MVPAVNLILLFAFGVVAVCKRSFLPTARSRASALLVLRELNVLLPLRFRAHVRLIGYLVAVNNGLCCQFGVGNESVLPVKGYILCKLEDWMYVNLLYSTYLQGDWHEIYLCILIRPWYCLVQRSGAALSLDVSIIAASPFATLAWFRVV